MTPARSQDVFVWTLKWARDHHIPLWAAETAESTNSVAKNETAPLNGGKVDLDSASDIAGPSLYIARTQTRGRGRGTNEWISTEGALLSSWRAELKKVPQPIFSAIAGLALFDAVSDTWPEVDFNLKAPNDLYIKDKKVAGLLIETVDMGKSKHSVIGLGLNVLTTPTEMQTATCLVDHLGEELTEEKWRLFLDNWNVRLKPAFKAGLETKLQPEVAQRLTEVLNRHPLLKEPIESVDEFGQLHSASRIVHWHEL